VIGGVRIIGLTGNIGCGKSTVAGMLRARGVATIDADVVAREIREGDTEARAEILRRFGTTDPARLAAAVFADPGALDALEAILHPRVRDAIRRRVESLGEALGEAGTAVACVEAIKLLESPLRGMCDAIWVVTCREEDAIARVAASRGMSETEARARLAHQSSQEAKAAAADAVVDGSAPIGITRRQVEAALRAFRERFARGT
jgi:dephospho-CoA kinase